jgi:two-component system, cell cycle response regulator
VPGAFSGVRPSPHNANNWVVVALAKQPAGTWVDQLGAVELLMGALGLLLLAYALLTLRSSHARLHTAATTDALTGLGNRRQLLADLEQALATGGGREFLLAIFDLDGFKGYNDTFGHPAGDALLTRLAAALSEALEGRGGAYRMGGDEFCLLAPVDASRGDEVVTAAERALTERGEGFTITCSRGSVVIPTETSEIDEALRLADQRMYARKSSGRASASRQSTDVLIRALAERRPELGDHLDAVTELTGLVGRELSLPPDQMTTLLQAASLHDIGKVAIPDEILAKPGPLTDDEWAFIHQHTIIGERILAVAPALADAARLVRASHERYDGAGYPDGLADQEIPLGSRIIGVCDAFHAMTSSRPYRITPLSVEAALAELSAEAGSQFDPEVVGAFRTALANAQVAEAPMAARARSGI